MDSLEDLNVNLQGIIQKQGEKLDTIKERTNVMNETITVSRSNLEITLDLVKDNQKTIVTGIGTAIGISIGGPIGAVILGKVGLIIGGISMGLITGSEIWKIT